MTPGADFVKLVFYSTSASYTRKFTLMIPAGPFLRILATFLCNCTSSCYNSLTALWMLSWITIKTIDLERWIWIEMEWFMAKRQRIGCLDGKIPGGLDGRNFRGLGGNI